MPEPLIEFRNVSYAAGERRILENLNLQVLAGETVVLLGRSGSGKTTALRLVNGMLQAASGSVTVLGKSVPDWEPERLKRSIGYVIQEGGLLPHFTVARNVGLVPELEGWPKERIQARVDELLHLVGLPMEVYGSRMPRQLSGGQRQRVGVARALAADPPVLLFDEPFGALDPVTRAELQREFLRLRMDLGKTSLFVTHDVREALLLGTRIVLLEAGRLLFDGTAANFRASNLPALIAFQEGANDVF